MWMFMLMLKKNSIKIPLGIKPAIRAKTESVLYGQKGGLKNDEI
jgi:hypothetical protein